MTSVTTRAVAFAKIWLLSFVLINGLLAPGLASADGYRPFSRIVVFGDSLSDPGNVYALTGGTTVVAPPTYGMVGVDPLTGIPKIVPLIPDGPYASKRFTNGLTWVELFGGALGLAANVKPAFASPPDPRAFNFAVAGATAADVGFSEFPLAVQTGAYLARTPLVGTSSDTLYVIAIGGNDVRAALLLGPAVLDLTLAAIEQAIRDLHDVGGTKFLIWNIPDVGGTPGFQRLQNGAPEVPLFPGIPNIADNATALVAAPAPFGYNARLKARLQELSAPASEGGLGVEIIHFDAFAELAMVKARPGRFGLTNVDAACIQPFVGPLFRCARPDRYLMWDGIHPTRATHAILAFLVGKALVTHALQDD